MSRSRTLAPMLGLTALAALSSFAAAPAARAQTSYTVIDLGDATNTSQAYGASGFVQVGYTEKPRASYENHAALWRGTAASAVNLNPTGFYFSEARAVSGNTQIGHGYGAAGPDHALLWHGTADSVVDLNPEGIYSSEALGISGDAQVGQGYGTNFGEHALLWHGTADSAVDLNPAGASNSEAFAVSGNTQVGSSHFSYLSDIYNEHAALWHGTAASVIDINPAGFFYSQAMGAPDNTQVGVGFGSGADGNNVFIHALLWHGTADGVVDLHPNGFGDSYADGVFGDTQVGYGAVTYAVNTSPSHALLWHGTAGSYVDLDAYLPAGYNKESQALGIAENGDIVGYGSGSKGMHAFLWHGTFVPRTLPLGLSPAYRTSGRGAFTLTVFGTGFTSKSVVMWNGAAQPTTFVSVTQLTARIPASLTASAGTAQVSVVTPSQATTGSLRVIINPGGPIRVSVVDLNPAGFESSSASGVSGGSQVGGGMNADGDSRALLWKGSAASVVDLTPSGAAGAGATSVSGSVQGGSRTDPYDNDLAQLWTGTASSAIDLHPSQFDDSRVNGVAGDTQVGYGISIYDEDEYTYSIAQALLWHGTADSVINLNPAGFAQSQAFGVSGDTQVGFGDIVQNGSSLQHALLWHGTAASAVDLHPTNLSGFIRSVATGVSGPVQVGTGYVHDIAIGGLPHALLWHGTAASAVDLTPTNLSGYANSSALAVSGNIQVGYGSGVATGGQPHALLWRGTADTAIDLNEYLPEGFNMVSQASSIDGNADAVDVVGQGNNLDDNGNYTSTHAFLWHITFTDNPTVLHLYPASRTTGRDAFTLTVSGSGFTSDSKVQWNGTAQATTFVSSTTLTASIPASLIATPGTASVTVNTLGIGTSNSHAETIMARPTLASLSPASKQAGNGSFTLTLTGTGFRPASFYAPSVVKWNGVELATTYVSDTKLTAEVPASLAAQSGMAQVAVTTPQVATTQSKVFTITP